MGGNHPCPPLSPCWCVNHPNHPHCINNPSSVPIDDDIWILVAMGIFLVYKTIKK